MHKDTQQELERLEQELLAEEEKAPRQSQEDAFHEDAPTMIFEESDDSFLEEIEALLGPETVPQAENTDRTEEKPEACAQQLLEEEKSGKSSLKGLVILAACLTLGIVAVVGWWVVRILGGGL